MSKKQQTELMERPQQQPLATSDGNNPIAAMLQAIVDKGITAENAAAMEKLTDLYLRVQSENARKDFAKAKAALQAELPTVAATRPIPNRDGTVRSTFAAYEDISEQTRPALARHGFSVDYTQRIDAGGKRERMAAICKLTHSGGHSEVYEFAATVCAPPGASEAQGDGSTWSYAKRGALCAALDIVVDHDSDARAEGGTITPEQARDIERRVEAIGGDKAKFLRLAGTTSFAEIRTAKMDVLERLLEDRQRAAKPAATPKASERREVRESVAPPTEPLPPVTEHEAAMAAQARPTIDEHSRQPSAHEAVAISLAEVCDCSIEAAMARLDKYSQQFFKRPFASLGDGTVKSAAAKVKDGTIRV